MSAVPTPARAEATLEGDGLVVNLGGAWRITQPLPVLAEGAGRQPAARGAAAHGRAWSAGTARS